MALIKCVDCGKEISDTSKVCIHCGSPVEKQSICKECGEKVYVNDKACNNCGCSLKITNRKSTFFGVLYIVIGLLSIIWGLQLNYYGNHSKEAIYGGDAYTGIQNASSKTANNVNELGDLLCISFKGILIVMGGTIIIYGISTISKKEGN